MFEFLKQTFSDASGNPDGKWLTVFGACLVIFGAVPVFYFTGKELPEVMWYTFAGIVVAGIGLGSIETISKQNKPNNE